MWAETTPPDTSEPAETSAPDVVDDTEPSETGADAVLDVGGEVDASDAIAEVDGGSDVAAPVYDPESASVDSVFDQATSYFAVLGLEEFLAVTDDSWVWVDPAGARQIASEEGLTATTPSAVARLASGTVVAAVDDALVIVTDSEMIRSPIGDIIDPISVTALLATPDGALWIGTNTALHRWQDGLISEVAPIELVVANAALAWGAPVKDKAGLWLSTESGVFALTESGSGLQAWPEEPSKVGASLAADSQGVLWILADGEVVRRTPDAVWRATELPADIQRVRAHYNAAHSWFVDATGAIYHHHAGQLTKLDNPPANADSYGVDADGRLLAAGDDGIVRISPGRVLSVLGLNPGSVIEAPVLLTIRASSPELVDSVVATIDGLAIDVGDRADEDSRVWEVTLNPYQLDRGVRELKVTVVYADEDVTLDASLSFEVSHTTWTEHVASIYSRRCSPCHNDVAGASTAVLDHSGAWTSRIDCIICRVTNPFDITTQECQACQDDASSMPPTGPIQASEYQTILKWRAGGFREE